MFKGARSGTFKFYLDASAKLPYFLILTTVPCPSHIANPKRVDIVIVSAHLCVLTVVMIPFWLAA